ncbi:MAG: ribonuclease III [Gammaproteobacteria bacterium]|nr:ribonuclease III [Gammaproteobacteria bacterium]
MGPTQPERWVRERLGHSPRDPALFVSALTHRSAGGAHNERLEFLGDAALNFLIAHQLYRAFPAADEGDLSRLRARLVSREPLAEIAAAHDMRAVLHLGAGELKSGGFRRQSILADALEALLGALYLDAGLAGLEPVVERLFGPRIAALPEPASLKDAKTRLQEYLQSRGLALPRYTVLAIAGEDHAQRFTVSCEAAPLRLSGRGEGSSRRRAEQGAAAAVLAQLGAGVDG